MQTIPNLINQMRTAKTFFRGVDWNKRVQAAQSLGNLKDPSAVADLQAVIHENRHEALVRTALTALAEIGDETAVRALGSVFSTADLRQWQIVTVESLARATSPTAVTTLLQATSVADASAQAKIIETLQSLPPSRTVQSLTAVLSYEVPVVPDIARQVLSSSTDFIPSLIMALDNNDRRVRQQVVKLLSQYGKAVIRPFLQLVSEGQHLNDEGRTILTTLGEAVYRIGLLHFIPNESVVQLLRQLSGNQTNEGLARYLLPYAIEINDLGESFGYHKQIAALLALDPNLAVAHCWAGDEQAIEGKLREAIECYEKAFKLGVMNVANLPPPTDRIDQTKTIYFPYWHKQLFGQFALRLGMLHFCLADTTNLWQPFSLYERDISHYELAVPYLEQAVQAGLTETQVAYSTINVLDKLGFCAYTASCLPLQRGDWEETLRMLQISKTAYKQFLSQLPDDENQTQEAGQKYHNVKYTLDFYRTSGNHEALWQFKRAIISITAFQDYETAREAFKTAIQAGLPQLVNKLDEQQDISFINDLITSDNQTQQKLGLFITQQILEQNPDWVYGYVILGYYNLKHNNVTQAISYFSKAYQAEPHNVQFAVILANIYLTNQQLEAGLDLFNSLVANNKEVLQIYVNWLNSDRFDNWVQNIIQRQGMAQLLDWIEPLTKPLQQGSQYALEAAQGYAILAERCWYFHNRWDSNNREVYITALRLTENSVILDEQNHIAWLYLGTSLSKLGFEERATEALIVAAKLGNPQAIQLLKNRL